MEKEYRTGLIEMGKAEELILGKEGEGPDESAFNLISDELDE
jgi:hypothetical protein